MFLNTIKCLRLFRLFNKQLYSNFIQTNNKYVNCNSIISFKYKSSFRNFCIKNNEIEPETEILEEIDLKDILQDYDGITSTTPKFILYPNETDELIIELNNCTKIDQILNKINENKHKFTHKHCIQSILLLWEHHRTMIENENRANKSSILQLPEFQWILNKIEEYKQELCNEELSCCVLYLSKLEMPIQNTILQSLILEILAKLNNDDVEFPLTALSRYLVALSIYQNDFYMYLVTKDTIPRVLKYLEDCNDAEDFRLITVCLNHVYKLITDDILLKYNEKLKELLKENIITPDSIRCLLKTINFLNYPQWSQENSKIVRQLAIMLKDNISKLHTRDLLLLFKVVQSHLEPAILLPTIMQHSQSLLKIYPSAELLACSVLYSLPEKRQEMIKIANQIVHGLEIPTTSTTLPALFKVLRILKISNVDLIDTYWDKVLHEIKINPDEQESYKIARSCHRYMHFNNNLGGTYRHIEFETFVTQLIIKELQHGLSRFIPSKYVKLSSFILAYGNTKSDHIIFPEFIMEKLESIAGQLNILDCLQLSRGLQIALEMRFKYFVPKPLGQQLVRIENLLNTCAERHLNNTTINLSNINLIIRSFNNRKSTKKTLLYDKIIRKYEILEDELNSRLVRDITFNLNASGYRIEKMFDKLLNYVHLNRDYVLGDTVEKVITCCYNLGYVPDHEYALQSSIDIINRDFDYMSGLSIVQACLALCYFKVLPESLINRVFNIDFITRLEDEIKMCYSKETYPERVLNQVMQLNRAVCLDYPESRVPWFQQNYIEAQLSKHPKPENQFQLDVKNLLHCIVPDKQAVTINQVTPYGYRIDFVLHYDKNNNFISPPLLPSSTSMTQKPVTSKFNIMKIAILLPKYASFCENDSNFFHGIEYLKQRHLEILGYRVIHINYSIWNSMFMNIPNAKLNYLKNLLKLE